MKLTAFEKQLLGLFRIQKLMRAQYKGNAEVRTALRNLRVRGFVVLIDQLDDYELWLLTWKGELELDSRPVPKTA